MSKWYMITTVPVGTCAWVAELGEFRQVDKYDRGEAYERFEASQMRASDFVGDVRSTPQLYKAMTGKPLPRDVAFWAWTGEPDPYRLALIGGDLVIPYVTPQGYTEKQYRFSTNEEALEALRVMEGVNERLESGEEALQPFARDIRAYLNFYRSVRPGEEELVYSHT